MRIVYWGIYFFLLPLSGTAQDVGKNLKDAILKFEADSQMRHAIYSLYIVDGKTGKVIFDKNAQIGLAPASTQKLITSGTVFELLGNDYRYKTQLAYRGKIDKQTLEGDLYVIGSGDPTLGSWRWKETRDSMILKKWLASLKSQGIDHINGLITTNESKFTHQGIPGGWIWDDIGNYYGAGSYALNWKENQYQVRLTSGKNVGDSVEIEDTVGLNEYVNELKSGLKGTGDNAYIYLSSGIERHKLIKGTIPVNEKLFSISGASGDPVSEVLYDFAWYLIGHSIHSVGACIKNRDLYDRDSSELSKLHYFDSHFSPTLDSMNYWFLRRSINLYGEAFIKTIAFEKTGFGSTDKGVELVKEFWSKQGIDKAAINIMDGSGLSPQNRVTANALVRVLQYSKTRAWYNSFYTSLPTYNGMKMKSGSIGGARSFAGYHTSKDGHEYIFAIIVNNYDGSSTSIVRKMYALLDNLK